MGCRLVYSRHNPSCKNICLKQVSTYRYAGHQIHNIELHLALDGVDADSVAPLADPGGSGGVADLPELESIL
jgi:hypothetical protein